VPAPADDDLPTAQLVHEAPVPVYQLISWFRVDLGVGWNLIDL